MNYREAKVYLQETAKYGSVLGLETINRLLEEADHPEDDLKIIHIAGTNGKGSTLSFLSSVLTEAGYKAGCFSSPAVFHPREIIRIGQEMISEEAFGHACETVKQYAGQMTEKGFAHPTTFEIEFAIALLYFKDQKCDYVILETGLGGAEDATNIVKRPLLSIITPISLDHTGILGKSIEEIAAQKAGIIKSGVPVVCGRQLPQAEKVIRETCGEKNTKALFLKKEDISNISYGMEKQRFSCRNLKDIEITLAGNYQVENAALAYLSVTELIKQGIDLTESHIRAGLRQASWKGRFSLIHKNPLFFIDGAHNEHGAAKLKESVSQLFPGRKIVGIMGVFQDKNYEQIVKLISPVTDTLITVTTPVAERALPAEQLAETAEKYIKYVHHSENVEEAVIRSLETAGEDGIIVAFGSLSYLSQIPAVLEKAKGEG